VRVFGVVEGLVVGVLWEWEVFCRLFWLWGGSMVVAVAAGGLAVVSMGSVAILSCLLFWFGLGRFVK
jgi:hypothetical protein